MWSFRLQWCIDLGTLMLILPLLITNSLMGYGTYGFSYFNVSSATANWTEANGTCFLALPSVTFDGKYTLIDDVIGDAMINDSWLGYFRYGYILAYYGCWNMAGVSSNTTTLTVADCMDYCLNRDSKSAIAVRNTSCYCISAVPRYNKDTTCDLQCPKESFTCGSTDSLGASVYLWDNDQTFNDDDQDNHECLAVIGGHHKWRPCSELHPLQCSNDYLYVVKGDWMTYQDRCPQSSGGHNSWTNIVRAWSTFIHNHTETKRITGRRWVEFGYLVKRNNRTYMEFAPASMEKLYICQSNADMVTSLGGITVLEASNLLLITVCAVALIVLTVFTCVCIKQKRRLPTSAPSLQSREGQAVTVSEPVVYSAHRVMIHQDCHMPATNYYDTVSVKLSD